MLRLFERRSHKLGLPPGTLIPVGEPRVEQARITIIDYDQQELEEREVAAAELLPYKRKPSVTWINLEGSSDVRAISEVGEQFGLHPLTTEDIVNSDQRPKVEVFDEYVFLVLKMLRYEETEGVVLAEQVSLVFGQGFVISFQEAGGDVFDPVRQRIRAGKGRLRRSGADYLVYALLDAVVDGYFLVLEKLGERVEELEEEVMESPEPDTSREIHEIKRELLILRKAVWPLREVVAELERSGSGFLSEPTALFLRDVYDHAIRVAETVETFREMVGGMRDLYMTGISNRMNSVMKVLTIIATIFIPLTFLAGVYGMNFKHMPELKWRWSYPALWGVMVISVVGMLAFFKRKKWL